MREIKFRVWHTERKMMYWFDLLWGNRHGTGEGWLCGTPVGEDRKPLFMRGDNREELDPDKCEIMQFTGLHDKNWKEVFENDLVKRRYNIFRVLWFDEGAGFIFQNIKDTDDCWCPNEYSVANEWEVIGTIYENPELLATPAP